MTSKEKERYVCRRKNRRRDNARYACAEQADRSSYEPAMPTGAPTIIEGLPAAFVKGSRLNGKRGCSATLFRLGLFLACLCVLSDLAGAQINEPYKILNVPDKITRGRFDPFGGYKILGRKPRDFADFDNFTLDLAEPPVKGQDLKVVGAVVTSSITSSENRTGAVYQISEIDLGATNLFFKTEAKEGVSYGFKGRFLKSGDLAPFRSKKIAVLEGELTKYVDGVERVRNRFRFSFVVWKVRYYARRTEKRAGGL